MQKFLNEKLKFYLRKTSSVKPQLLYANLKIGEQRYVISSNLKVLPKQFDLKRQLAIQSNQLTQLDNSNNQIVNDYIKDFRVKYEQYIEHLKDHPLDIGDKEILFNFVPCKRKGMGRRKSFTKTLEYILTNALNQELKSGQITQKTLAAKTNHINLFVKWALENKLPNDVSALTFSTWKKFSEYLQFQHKSTTNKPLNVRTACIYLSTLKSVTATISESDEYGYIDTTRWKLPKINLNTEESKSRQSGFTEEDYNKILNYECKKKNDNIIRDFFVFSCNVGQRPSDCVRILKGECSITKENGIDLIQLIPHKTRKTGNYATIPIFNPQLIYPIMEKFVTDDDYKDYLNKSDAARLQMTNKYLKKIFHDCGLDDLMTITEQKEGEIVTTEVKKSNNAHSYLSRHYFVTMCLLNGMKKSVVVEITGHSSEKMVNDVYSHITKGEKAKLLASDSVVQNLANGDDAKYNKAKELQEKLLENYKRIMFEKTGLIIP